MYCGYQSLQKTALPRPRGLESLPPGLLRLGQVHRRGGVVLQVCQEQPDQEAGQQVKELRGQSHKR